MHESEIGTAVMDCAVQLYQDLVVGLRESVDEEMLALHLEIDSFFKLRTVQIQ